MKKAPSEHPIRRGAAIAAGGMFLILAIVYTLVSYAPTGYAEFREKQLRQAQVTGKRTPIPAPRPVSLPAPPPAADPGAEPTRPRTLAECLIAFRYAVDQDFRNDHEQASWYATNHPLLDSLVPHYRPVGIREPVVDFDAARWRECIGADMDSALPQLEAATRELAIGDPGRVVARGISGGETIEVELAPMLRSLADIADAELFNQDIQLPGLGEETVAPYEDFDLAGYAIPSLVRSILRNDAGATRRRVGILHHLLLRDPEQMRSFAQTVNDRMEPLLVIAAERGQLDAEELAAAQACLEEMRLDEAQARERRTARILSAADSLLDDPSVVRPRDNAWSFFLDGIPSTLAAEVMRPAFNRSVESYAVAMVKGNPAEMQEARARMLRSTSWMNAELKDAYGLTTLENNEFLLSEIAGGRAPYLVDLDTTLNQSLDTRILILAACRHRVDKGAWPEQPADLVPDYTSSDYTLRGLLARRFLRFSCPHCGQRHFAVASGQYETAPLWEGATEDQSWPESKQMLQKNMERDPENLLALMRANRFCLYEKEFRRVLCPGTEEATTP